MGVVLIDEELFGELNLFQLTVLSEHVDECVELVVNVFHLRSRTYKSSAGLSNGEKKCTSQNKVI
jgi:hypothetical protein